MNVTTQNKLADALRAAMKHWTESTDDEMPADVFDAARAALAEHDAAKPEVWTVEDSRAAMREGWDVFHVDGSYFDIQRDDAAEIFSEDTFALAHVYFAGSNGSPLHMKAWRIVLSPENVAAIIAARGVWGAA